LAVDEDVAGKLAVVIGFQYRQFTTEITDVELCRNKTIWFSVSSQFTTEITDVELCLNKTIAVCAQFDFSLSLIAV
jgi:hypothetical protein